MGHFAVPDYWFLATYVLTDVPFLPHVGYSLSELWFIWFLWFVWCAGGQNCPPFLKNTLLLTLSLIISKPAKDINKLLLTLPVAGQAFLLIYCSKVAHFCSFLALSPEIGLSVGWFSLRGFASLILIVGGRLAPNIFIKWLFHLLRAVRLFMWSGFR